MHLPVHHSEAAGVSQCTTVRRQPIAGRQSYTIQQGGSCSQGTHRLRHSLRHRHHRLLAAAPSHQRQRDALLLLRGPQLQYITGGSQLLPQPQVGQPRYVRVGSTSQLATCSVHCGEVPLNNWQERVGHPLCDGRASSAGTQTHLHPPPLTLPQRLSCLPPAPCRVHPCEIRRCTAGRLRIRGVSHRESQPTGR